MQHRIRPAPVDPHPADAPRIPINTQTWESLSMLHWTVPAGRVQRLLPRGLIVDEYDGQTWLGVVPFVMSGVRVPPFPALGPRSTFPELNVRVYVYDLEGNRGVWFLGLWCTSRGFVASTRALGLPYHRARGEAQPAPGRTLSYRFLRADSAALTAPSDISFNATVRAANDVDATTGLEAWLTARWNMFAYRAGRLWRYPVHHEPWSLRAAIVEDLGTNAHARFGFSQPRIEPIAHVAEPVHTLVSAPRPCGMR
ncbi:YqjF family protein [Leucobacter celer]|uniref:YqjF family protein n=1 Tax=Leucobacter celer TaxID=668625 RepID=UPI0006A7BD32|nr:DUF2071 domain-containing protein [Leucobacter celer]